jgi:hypothetical protein
MKMQLLKNKKGDDRYLVFWLIFNFMLIVVALYAVIAIFYSTSFDVRQREARLLGLTISDCLQETQSDFLSSSFDIFKECAINKKVIENGNYYINVSFSENRKRIREDIILGTGKYEIYCALGKTAEGENLPECFENKFYAAKGIETKNIENNYCAPGNGNIEIKVLTASNQIGVKV